MPIDNTNLFKACVKTVKIRDKALKDNNNVDNKTSILKSTKRKSEFMCKSTGLVKEIGNLRDFILQYRKAYLNFTPNFVNTDQMTEEERDEIDGKCGSIVSACWSLVKELKGECRLAGGQTGECQEVVVELIEAYLRSVCKIFSQLTATRSKWRSDLQKISGRELDVCKPSAEPTRISSKQQNSESRGSGDKIHDGDEPKRQKASPYNEPHNEDIGLTEEEMQAFQLENDLLYNDLNAVNDEVRAIQTKVVKIAELQSVFSERVLEQNEELERITSSLVGTTENIRDANTHIRKAIQNNAGLRIYLLFFLLVMSFSLLFLDWYND